ncbi:MAG: MBL fold metallo-hydrolase [Usitatibacter sp.]
MIFRQLFDPQSSTYSYLLGDEASGEAVLIDSVFEQARRDAALVRELGLELAATLETHVHADHVTGAWALKQRTGSSLTAPAKSGASGADRYLGDGDRVTFGSHVLTARTTPGHTGACLTYVLEGGAMAFTGDALLIRGTGRTDFQQGSAQALYHSVRDRILSLPDATLLYPAHDYRGLTVTSVAEEKRYNPRLGGEISEADFAGHMANLHLPHPRLIDIAVPANLRCGRPESAIQDDPSWAPLTYTFAGLLEIQPEALEECGASVQVLDVREPAELTGALGHIKGALAIPLGELAARVGELDRARPVVAVCRSGARSAQAVTLLGKAGFDRVANLAGGMQRWRAGGHAVEDARE